MAVRHGLNGKSVNNLISFERKMVSPNLRAGSVDYSKLLSNFRKIIYFGRILFITILCLLFCIQNMHDMITKNTNIEVQLSKYGVTALYIFCPYPFFQYVNFLNKDVKIYYPTFRLKIKYLSNLRFLTYKPSQAYFLGLSRS